MSGELTEVEATGRESVAAHTIDTIDDLLTKRYLA